MIIRNITIRKLKKFSKHYPIEFNKTFYKPHIQYQEGYHVHKQEKLILNYIKRYHIITNYTLRGPEPNDYGNMENSHNLGQLYSFLNENGICIKKTVSSQRLINEYGIVTYALYDIKSFKDVKAARYVTDKIFMLQVENGNL